MHSQTTQYRPDIDALRAIAVAIVVLFHGQIPLFSGGFVGVDVFFVISGFLISGIILAKLETNSFSFKSFLGSRLRRIFPALFIMVLVVFLLCITLPIYLDDFLSLRRSAPSSLLFYSNIFFYLNTGYFDTPAITQVFLHTWSLSVEMQFYLVYPFFLFFIHSKWKSKITTILFISFLLFLLLTLIAVYINPKASFFFFPTRAWELILGGWLASSRATPKMQSYKKCMIILGISSILISSVVFNNLVYPNFPGGWAIIPCLGTVFFISGFTGLDKTSSLASIASNKKIIYIGLISYSLYLWHWPIFAIYHRVSFNKTIPIYAFCAMLALSVLLAHASWKYIETPVRRILAKKATLYQLLSLLTCIVIVVSLAKLFANPFNLSNSTYAKGAQDRVPFKTLSLIGAKNAPPSFLVWGDSHADAIAILFDTVGKKTGQAGRYIYSDAHLVNGYRIRSINDRRELESNFAQVISDDKPKSVFILNRWSLGIKGFFPTESATPMLDYIGFYYDNGNTKYFGEQALKESLVDTVEFLLKSKVENIYIFLPIPESYFHIPRAATIASALSNEDEINTKLGVSFSDYKERHKEVLRVLHSISSKYDSVILVDPGRVLFGGRDKSLVVEGGKTLYYDDDHLSSTGAIKLRNLVEQLKPFDGANQPADKIKN